MSRPRTDVLFEISGHWIASEPGTKNLYHFWHDNRAGRTRRESLRTADLEGAKRKLAELVVAGAPKTKNAALAVVLERYFTERTDKKPSKGSSRNAGKILLRHFGLTVRVSALTEEKQKEFAEEALAKGQRLSYIARNMTVLKAALRFSKIDHEVIYTESQMRDRWGLTSAPKRKARIPTDEEIAKLWSTSMSDDLRRFLLIQLTTGGRPQTAIDLTPAQRSKDAGLVHLNPPGRPQNKKHRPELREARVLTGWLDKWEEQASELEIRGGRYCGFSSIDGVESSLKRAVRRAGIPHITLYSFRHKVTTILRLARVPEDEISLWMGHRRPHLRTTGEYGEWDPGYLATAAAAIDAWFARAQLLTEQPLFSRGIPESIRVRMEKTAQAIENLERARRIERPTLTLARLCSTPELRPHIQVGRGLWPSGRLVSIALKEQGFHRLPPCSGADAHA